MEISSNALPAVAAERTTIFVALELSSRSGGWPCILRLPTRWANIGLPVVTLTAGGAVPLACARWSSGAWTPTKDSRDATKQGLSPCSGGRTGRRCVSS